MEALRLLLNDVSFGALSCALAMLISGCAIPTPSARFQTAAGIASQGEMVPRRFQTEGFHLMGYWRPGKGADPGIRVYLEGDGLAWISRSVVSLDPTPIDPVALRMAASDPSRLAILYLARPCQYVGASDPDCGPEEWTQRRYSAQSATAISQAIDLAIERQARERSGAGNRGASEIEIVGYSGGGVLAVNVAAMRADVSLVVTVAAPLDVSAWTEHHGISPLTGSINPTSQAKRLASIPQLHLIGANDEIVPSEVTHSYLAALGDLTMVRIVEVPGYDHHCCWARDWPELSLDLTRL